MNKRIEEGMDMLFALGSLIEDEGHENDGNILIQPMDEKKFHLIENVLDYMGFLDVFTPLYELLYDDAYYLKDEFISEMEDGYNEHVIGMILHKKEIEKTI